MKRIILLIPIILMFAGCHWFFPFNKYDQDSDPVNVDWTISAAGTNLWHLDEKSSDESVSADVYFDGSYFKFANNISSSGRAPTFGNLVTFGDQAPFYYMFGYLDLFLDNFDLSAGSGYFDSGSIAEHQDMEWFGVSWSTYTTTACDIPYPAEIDGFVFKDILDSSQLTSPGTLYVVEFYSDSYDPFMRGSGIAVFHNGTPNGLLYFSFEHANGYTSLLTQTSCTTSSAGTYWGAMSAQYRWFYFAH